MRVGSTEQIEEARDSNRVWRDSNRLWRDSNRIQRDSNWTFQLEKFQLDRSRFDPCSRESFKTVVNCISFYRIIRPEHSFERTIETIQPMQPIGRIGHP